MPYRSFFRFFSDKVDLLRSGAEWLLALAIHIGQIRCGIENYAQQMADDSRRHGLDPIPLRLSASPQQIENELHRSMWDVAIGQSLDEPVDVLAEAAGVADSVDAAIGAAWSIRERVRVHDTPPADSPDGPAVFRPTVVEPAAAAAVPRRGQHHRRRDQRRAGPAQRIRPMTTTESPQAGRIPIPAVLANLMPAGRARLTQRWMLLLAGLICLVQAAQFVQGAVRDLTHGGGATGVDAAGVSEVAAFASIALVIVFAGAAAVLTELALPQPLGLLRGVRNGRFVGGTAGARAGYIAIVFFNSHLATSIMTARPVPGSGDAGPSL